MALSTHGQFGRLVASEYSSRSCRLLCRGKKTEKQPINNLGKMEVEYGPIISLIFALQYQERHFVSEKCGVTGFSLRGMISLTLRVARDSASQTPSDVI